MKNTRSASSLSMNKAAKDFTKTKKKNPKINKFGLDKRQAKAQGYNSGEWSNLENYLYREFLIRNRQLVSTEEARRKKKVFSKM